MKKYSLEELKQEVLYLQHLLENELDEDKQLDFEKEIEFLQAEISSRKEKDSEKEQ